MSKLETIGTYSIPAYALPYLINGDSTGIDDDDQQAVEDWLAAEFLSYNCLVFAPSDEASFTHCPAFGLACDAVDTVVSGHPCRFEYFINLDERSDFYADVRCPAGNTVFSIRGFEIFDDGFMKHKHDLTGLQAYLLDLGIMQPAASLVAGQ